MLDIEAVTVAHVRRGAFGRRVAVDVVHDVSLQVPAGRIVALVGDSGCGKSTLARTVVALHRPRLGTVRFAGTDVHALSAASLRAHRRHVQLIGQDPFGSFDRTWSVTKAIGEALTIHELHTGPHRRRRILELLDLVGLPAAIADRRPGQLSGGQVQRVAIARALAVEPRVLICDEPVTALDVSTQARVLNLLLDLRDQLGLGCLFIAHDLGVVAQLADEVAVMHDGRIVEHAPTREAFESPCHPQTARLLDAIPRLPAPTGTSSTVDS